MIEYRFYDKWLKVLSKIDSNRTVVFVPKLYAGFANNVRALRGLIVFCLLYDISLRVRGHFSPVRDKENAIAALEGTVCDLGVLSFMKTIYFTKGSSFGRFASKLSDSEIIDTVALYVC